MEYISARASTDFTQFVNKRIHLVKILRLLLLVNSIRSIVGVAMSAQYRNEALYQPRFRTLRFERSPESVEVPRGSTAIFHCVVIMDIMTADGTRLKSVRLKSSHITWFKDSEKFHPAPNGSLIINTNKESTFDLCCAYRCKASYRGLTVLSTQAKLIIIDIQRPHLTLHSIREGEFFRWNCNVNHSCMSCKTRWYKNETEIGKTKERNILNRNLPSSRVKNRKRVLMLPSGALEFSRVEMKDAGSYHCAVGSQSTMWLSSRRSTLKIIRERLENTPPTPILTEQDVTGFENQPVILECAFSGHPYPKISWKKNGKAIDVRKKRNYSLYGRGNLLIRRLQRRDDAIFTCQAENGLGTSRKFSVTVTVKARPHITINQSERVYLRKGSNLNLKCTADGMPQPATIWYKNGRKLTQTSLVPIRNVIGEDAGLYQCFAMNTAGEVMVSTTIFVVKKGRNGLCSPMGVRAVAIDTSSINVTWQCDQSTDGVYYSIRYKINRKPRRQARFVNSTTTDALLQHLEPRTMYEIAVRTIYGSFRSPWSMAVTIRTPETTIPKSPPLNLSLTPVHDDPTAVEVTWQSPAKSSGQITGYMIYSNEDKNEPIRDWEFEPVLGDQVSAIINSLAPDSQYFLKIQARNEQGMGPYSEVISFRTPQHTNAVEAKATQSPPHPAIYVIIGVAIILCGASAVTVVMWRFRRQPSGKRYMN